jgi:hypothetical protein
VCIVSIAGFKGDRMCTRGPNSGEYNFRFAGLPGLFAGASYLRLVEVQFQHQSFFFVPKGDQPFEQILGSVEIEINCRTNVAEIGRWRVHMS